MQICFFHPRFTHRLSKCVENKLYLLLSFVVISIQSNILLYVKLAIVIKTKPYQIASSLIPLHSTTTGWFYNGGSMLNLSTLIGALLVVKQVDFAYTLFILCGKQSRVQHGLLHTKKLYLQANVTVKLYIIVDILTDEPHWNFLLFHTLGQILIFAAIWISM